MRIHPTVLIGAAFACAACNINAANRTFVRDPLAKLPSGDEIAWESELVQSAGQCTPTTTDLVWRRISPNQTLLAIEGRGEVRVTEHGKVLTARGDVPAWHQKYGQAFKTATIRVSPEGDRAWLVSDEHTIASFDYRESLAFFGEDLQPVWASHAVGR